MWHLAPNLRSESLTYVVPRQKSIRAVQRASFLLREKNDAESKVLPSMHDT